MGGKLHGSADATCSCARDEDAIAAVVFFSRANVLPVDTVSRPGCPTGGGFVDQDLGAGGCHWALVVIVSSVQIRVGGEFLVDTVGSKHVWSSLGLRYQPVS